MAHALATRGSRFARTLSGPWQNLFLPDKQDHLTSLSYKGMFYFILLKAILCKIA